MVALLGFGIAYRQWRTAQIKLKLDLFDRRFAVYQAVQQLVSDAFGPGPLSDEALTRYRVATLPARWLFDQAVAGYLDTNIYARIVQLQELTAELDGLQVGDARAALARERGQVKKASSPR